MKALDAQDYADSDQLLKVQATLARAISKLRKMDKAAGALAARQAESVCFWCLLNCGLVCGVRHSIHISCQT